MSRPFSVLVVDDVADAADTLAVLLALHGFTVRTALDGASALLSAAGDPPDAVVTDLAMPGMTGWELARRLREQVIGSEPFVVAVTGCTTEEDRRRSAEAGIDLHLAKPVEPAELVAILSRLRDSSGPG